MASLARELHRNSAIVKFMYAMDAARGPLECSMSASRSTKASRMLPNFDGLSLMGNDKDARGRLRALERLMMQDAAIEKSRLGNNNKILGSV